MKRVNNLYQQISMGDMLRLYQKQVRANTKNKHKIYKFEEYFTANITNVYNLFHSDDYKVSDYNIFLIRDPKYRIIMSQKMKRLEYLYHQKKVTKKDIEQVIASYQGHLKYGNTYFLRKKYLKNIEKKVS